MGEAFEGYWRKVPHIKRMEFHIISEPATRLAMVKRGEIGHRHLMQGVFYEDLKKDSETQTSLPAESDAMACILYFPVGPQVSLV